MADLDGLLPYTCTTCGTAHNRTFKNNGVQRRASYCWKCHAARMRATRPKHRDLPDEQRRRANARAYTRMLQARGKLTPQPCEMCGSAEVERHHEDYSNPRLVRWLCRPCHLQHHVEERAA